jgi:hypothetical protein
MCWRWDATQHDSIDTTTACPRCLKSSRYPGSRHRRAVMGDGCWCPECHAEMRAKVCMTDVPERERRPQTGDGSLHFDEPDSGHASTSLSESARLLMGFAMLGQGGFGESYVSTPSFPTRRAHGASAPLSPSDAAEDTRAKAWRKTGRWMSVEDAEKVLFPEGKQ